MTSITWRRSAGHGTDTVEVADQVVELFDHRKFRVPFSFSSSIHDTWLPVSAHLHASTCAARQLSRVASSTTSVSPVTDSAAESGACA